MPGVAPSQDPGKPGKLVSIQKLYNTGCFLMFLCHSFWIFLVLGSCCDARSQGRLEPPDMVKQRRCYHWVWCGWPDLPKWYLTRCDADWPDPAFAVASGQNSTAGKI